MKRPIAIVLGLALLASAGAVFARGNGSHGGGRGGHAAIGHAGVGARVMVGAHVPGVRSSISVRPGPVFIGRPHFFHRHRAVVGSTVVIAAPLFYPYPYYPPVYATPVYTDPPVYVEQGGGVYYYCTDYNDYYPNVATCPTQWVPVSATAGETPR